MRLQRKEGPREELNFFVYGLYRRKIHVHTIIKGISISVPISNEACSSALQGTERSRIIRRGESPARGGYG